MLTTNNAAFGFDSAVALLAIALRLGRDEAWRHDVLHRIAVTRNRLFDDPAPVADLAAFLLSLRTG